MTISITAAAMQLGISRTALYAALKAGRATLEPLHYTPGRCGRPCLPSDRSMATAARTLGVAPEIFYRAVKAGRAGMMPSPWYHPPTRASRKTRTLSECERRVVMLVCDGLTYVEIADRLDMSLEAVSMRVWRARQKLGVANRAELVRRIKGE